jgi:hypothetical protein
MATQSYRERMKAARAEARAKREAEKSEWHRRIELRYEIRKLALDAVKAGIRARGDKVQLKLYALEAHSPSANGQGVGRLP